jgi:AhpD family alkylhydroperoxidase
MIPADLCQNKSNYMSNRMKFAQVEPEAYKAMMDLGKYISSTQLSTTHKDLIKIRTSQVNGCAYCVDMHTKEARDAGETEQRLFALSVWRDTTFFTPEERALLALTEEVTLISQHVSDATYDQAVTLLGEKYVAQAIMAIISMNSWNRIGISTKMQPPAR